MNQWQPARSTNVVDELDGTPFLKLDKQLGEGKAGRVFEAMVLHRMWQLQAGDKVAAKFYKSWVLDEPSQELRIQREAQISSKVAHSNVAHIYGLVPTSRGPCLIMELLQGGTLRERMDGIMGDLSLCIQLLEGLSALHDVGIVHRDLKPENLLFDQKTSRLKIGDFGVVRTMDDETLTHTNQFLGTIRYAAPEYLFRGQFSPQSDQYSAGAIIYEIITGKPLVPAKGTFASQVLNVNQRIRLFTPQSHQDIVRQLALRMLLSSEPEGRFRHTRDAYLLFRDNIQTSWWQARIDLARESYNKEALAEQKQQQKAERTLAEIIQSGKASELLAAAEESRHNSEFSDCPPVYSRCKVCGNGTFYIGATYGSGHCEYCEYHESDEFAQWSRCMEGRTSGDDFFQLIALASALEDFKGLPSPKHLDAVQALPIEVNEKKKTNARFPKE